MEIITVLINDSGSRGYEFNEHYFGERHAWAQNTCPSYRGMHIQDVSDVSLQWDEIAEYRFEDEKDAMFFRLKWT